ncbi:phage tail spike protein [Enterococcus asini]|uniref:phage tail spike protein n=1 Tax=Enterococcus asini TaxID=57732 RepID=UPI0026DB94E6|nr:phage tail spike protein [Enterococcus asini]
MEFVYIYKELPEDLSTNGSALTDWKDLPEITRVLNDKFSFYGNYSLDGQNADLIQNGHFIKAKTENGTWQYFEIYEPKKTLDSISFNGRFIGAMANRNFIDYSFTDNGNGSQIMANLNSSLAFRQKFRYLSDVPTTHQFTAKQVGPIDAIVGSNNGNQNLVGVTGGELDVDNYDLKLVKQIGSDNGYRIDFGINLESIQSEVSEQTVNSLFLVGGVPDTDYDEDKDPLTYKFLEIEGVNDSNRRIGKRENSNCKTLEELKEWGQSLFDKDRIHEPTATHKVNMVALEHTLEYRELYDQFAKLHFGDVATVYVEKLGIDLKERMVEYVWFPTLGKYKSIVLGSNLSKYTSKTKTETEKLAEKINNRTETLVTNIINATAWITGNSGGHVVFRPEKGPSEILIMDTRDVASAKKIWRWNLNGLGYSSNGINGPYGLAMTSKGEIVADFIKVGIINTDVFQTSLKNASDDYLKLVGGALEVWNENMRLIQLTKNGMKFWYEGSEVGTMGTLGNPFPDIILPEGQKIEGNSIFVTTNGNNRFIGLSARKGSGIIIGMKQLMMIQDRLDMIVDIVQMTGRLDVKELYVNGVKIDTNGSGTGGPSGGDLTIFVKVLALTAKYEMGDRSSGYYHEPLDDGAGWNYGKYSFTEVYEMTPFLAWLASNYPSIRSALVGSVGTSEFNNSWAAYGAANESLFTGVQAEYFCRQKLKPMIEYLKSNTGVDLNDGNKWLGTLSIFSSILNWYPAAVQGGFFYRFVQQFASSWNDSSFITTVCDYIVANASSMVAPEYVAGIQNRFRAEKVDALALTTPTKIPFDTQAIGGYRIPIAKPITVSSEFGMRVHPITGVLQLHNGIDLVNGNPNTPILAANSGKVVQASGEYYDWYGNYVVIQHSDGLYTGYAHLSRIDVTAGQTVTAGQQLGLMGTTGPSTGEHLHFQFMKKFWPSGDSDFMNPREKISF